MFTPELERTRGAREQQQKQYYEELRAQIESKNRPIASPEQYSTTAHDMTANRLIVPVNTPGGRIRQYGQSPYSGQISGIRTQNQAPFANQAYSNQPVRSYPSGYSSSISSLHSDPLPEFTTTTIAPLNLNLTAYVADPVPSLPRQLQHTSGFDQDAFPERVRSIQSQMDDQASHLIATTEASDRIRTRTMPELSKAVSELDDLLEKTVTAKMPAAIKPVSDHLSHNRSLIETASHSVTDINNTIREVLNERVQDITAFNGKFTDFSEHTRSGFIEVKAENSRARDTTELSLQRILKLENKEASFIEEMSSRNAVFQAIDNESTQNFIRMQRDFTQLSQTAGTQLATEIKRESEQRAAVCQTLHSQAEEVNLRASNSISKLNETVSQINDAFGSSTAELAKNITEGLEQTQSENETATSDVSERLDSLVTETDSNFSVITDEIVSTISDLKQSFGVARGTLENAMHSEAVARQKNHDLIKNKFEHLRAIVGREQEIQMGRANDLVNGIKRSVADFYRKTVEPLNKDLEYLHAKSVEMDRVEHVVESVERVMMQARASVFDSVGSLQRSLQEIQASFSETRAYMGRLADDLEEELAPLEGAKKDDLALRDEALRAAELFSNSTEEKLKFIEQQLTAAMKNAAELTLGADEDPHRTQVPATSALAELAQEAENENPAKRKLKFPTDILDDPELHLVGSANESEATKGMASDEENSYNSDDQTAEKDGQSVEKDDQTEEKDDQNDDYLVDQNNEVEEKANEEQNDRASTNRATSQRENATEIMTDDIPDVPSSEVIQESGESSQLAEEDTASMRSDRSHRHRRKRRHRHHDEVQEEASKGEEEKREEVVV